MSSTSPLAPAWIAALALTLLGPGCLAAQDAASGADEASLDTARAAFMRHDLATTERVLERVAAGEPAPDDRAEALRMLAVLAWRFHGNPDLGRARLEQALEVPAGRSRTFAARSRLETATGHPERARVAAIDALRAAESEADSSRAVVRLAEGAVAAARREPWPEGRAALLLEEALEHLVPLVDSSPGLLEPARLQLLAALYRDEGPKALTAWRAYYAAALDRAGPLPSARSALERILPEWTGPEASPDRRRALVAALAASGFHAAARLVAVDPRVPGSRSVRHEPDVRQEIAYADFLRRIEEVTESYYRRTALGGGDPDAWVAELVDARRALWPRLAWDGLVPPFDDDAAVAELERRFLAEFNVGNTAGYLDLHFGHRVIDDRRTVDQYGHAADLRFVALDRMISNGFQSWAWDGRAAHGGWATETTIFQVRPGFVGGGIRAWRELSEPVTEAAFEARRATDLEHARRDPCSHLPGLRDRVHRDGLAWLRDSLHAEGLEGDDLRAAFLRAYDHAQVESSIFAHEGRHAIDRRLLTEDVGTEEREFRAKLSEVAFAPVPRLALRSINSPDAGDPTPHGQANRRILCRLAAWIEAHGDGIRGYDPTRPALPQLDLLDDARLRAAFRSMDPLAVDAAP